MSEQARPDIRVVVLGDSLVTATGDPKAMGWLGRVATRTPASSPHLEFYPLAVPYETSTLLLERWAREVSLRFAPDTQNRLVIMLPNTDPLAGVTLSRSRLNIATIVDEARKAGIESFLIGPTPHQNADFNREIEHLASGWEDVANRRGIPFVDCFRPLVDHEGWNSELRESVHGNPGQLGHGLIAWLVLNGGWLQWLGLTEGD